ncbi:hypothetical protein [Catellatospora vulcania]|uniref:hypothetical protein n=1 Tax=Catellatospora vulcania TaxID=1460450 RepID=UPI0012D43A90|nr:hypothetical protein [Catellatospora vulcania]
MSLAPDQLEHFQKRAREVGEKVGWELEFSTAPADPDIVGLHAWDSEGRGNFVINPADLANMAAHNIDLVLDLLENGTTRILRDHEGTVRIVDY